MVTHPVTDCIQGCLTLGIGGAVLIQYTFDFFITDALDVAIKLNTLYI